MMAAVALTPLPLLATAIIVSMTDPWANFSGLSTILAIPGSIEEYVIIGWSQQAGCHTSKNPTFFDQFKSSLDSHINNFINKIRIPEYTIYEDISEIDIEVPGDTKELFDCCYDILISLKASSLL